MSVLDEIATAMDSLKQAPADVVVAYLVNDEGFANMQKLVEHQKKPTGLQLISKSNDGQMCSVFSGIPIRHVPGLSTSVVMYADGSVKPMLT